MALLVRERARVGLRYVALVLPTFITELDSRLVDKMRASTPARNFRARSSIFREGDEGNGVFVIESGMLRVDRTTSSGRTALLDLGVRGGLVGELAVIDPSPRSASLTAVTAATLRYVPATEFRALLRDDPAFNAAVMARLARRLRSLSNQFLENSTMDASTRVAARLVRLLDLEQVDARRDLDRSGEIELVLPISQEELGQWAGLSREGASKGLATLRDAGILETGRKRVSVMDLPELLRRGTP